jgi:hypothetical protein
MADSAKKIASKHKHNRILGTFEIQEPPTNVLNGNFPFSGTLQFLCRYFLKNLEWWMGGKMDGKPTPAHL